MLGYEVTEILDASDALAAVLTTINPDDDPWLHSNLCVAKDFIDGLLAEGYVA